MWFCESIRRPREASSEANSDIGWGPHDSTNPSKDSSDDSTTRRRWRPFRLTRGRCRFERHTSARRLKRPRRRVQGQLISLLGTRMAAPPCFRLDAKPRRQTLTLSSTSTMPQSLNVQPLVRVQQTLHSPLHRGFASGLFATNRVDNTTLAPRGSYFGGQG